MGNVRLSYYKNPTGSVEALEENNYYPFGLKHSGYNNIREANPSYQYKYNGKELQETGMYDYGARMYMSDIGRWGTVDPLAEKSTRFSPYTYAFNNPIRFIDPDGRENEDWYRNNLTQNIEWHNGSGEIKGYENLGMSTAIGYSHDNNDGTWTNSNYTLNGDGTITNIGTGEVTNGGDSVITATGDSITSDRYSGIQGSINKFVDNLFSGTETFFNFYSTTGREYDGMGSDLLRSGDRVSWISFDDFIKPNGGGSGDMISSKLSIFNYIFGNLATSFNYTTDASQLIKKPADTLSYYGEQMNGIGTWKVNGKITGYYTTSQVVNESNLTLKQYDSIVNKISKDSAYWSNKVKSK